MARFGRDPGVDARAWVATAKNPLCVEHVCEPCGLWFQNLFREPGTTQEEAEAVPRTCWECERDMPVYLVYGGEYEVQPSLLGPLATTTKGDAK